MDKDIKNLFPITQAAKACGISRSTLLRLEERGLLAPAYIAPASGRRYYDNHNISRILQIQQFQSMGFDAEETIAYFTQEGDARAHLAILEKKLNMLKRSVEEMQLRAMEVPNMSVRILQIPEVTCMVGKYTGLTAQDKYDAMYNFYHECVKSGHVLSQEGLFVINERTDYLEGQITSTPYPFQVCVPILPEGAPADAVYFPSCMALSVLYYGSYGNLDKVWLKLGQEVKERGFTPIGFPRVVAIVAPYTGREIDPERYCSRFALPIQL